MSRTLKLTLLASLLAHASCAVYFYFHGRRAVSLKRGSIAVDFIQSVPHGALADPHHHPGRKARETQKENAVKSEPQTEAKPVGAPDAAARESDAYILAISQLINARKIYPRASVEREEEGRVIVAVTLDREGHLVALAVEEKAPFESLNRAALDTVQAVGHFPPIPEEVPDPIHLHIPLIFKIER